MGSVLTPLLRGLESSAELPFACTMCGRCAEVCPMEIPLPDLLRRLRFEAHDHAYTSKTSRLGLAVWTFLGERPKLMRLAARLGGAMMRLPGAGALRRWPLAGAWTAARDLPVPEGGGFIARANAKNGD